MIWIVHTTLYREGGAKFARAAATLARELRERLPGAEVVAEAVESKREFVDGLARIRESGRTIDALHFIGHSGMYGPMFRTRAMPEQFSPHEWRHLAIPFAPGAVASFHACRTARWFAPFFARTFSVEARGYHWYTTVSRSPDRFAWERPGAPADAPLYVIGCPGKKSHGWAGSLRKYLGRPAAEAMKSFTPGTAGESAGYDEVARLYDEAFADLSVRRDECEWIDRHLPAGRPAVLDIGCGNGALLRRLSGRIASGVGVDASPAMVARAAAAGGAGLSYRVVDGPALPLPDASVDCVISLLSFRYLDWDPLMLELMRVLRPGGRILIVDMVTAPLRWREWPNFLRSKWRMVRLHRERPEFAAKLRRLVGDPRWKKMLEYNPIRAEHEFKWYLESRFPPAKTELLNAGFENRVLAFDSGPLQPGWVAPQSYP